MPTGYYVSYGGQFRNLEAAQKRLILCCSDCLALDIHFVLLYISIR